MEEKKQNEKVKERNGVEKVVEKGEAKRVGLSLKFLLINILVSLMVAVGVVYVYDRYYAQKIVAFDLRGYLWGLRDMYLAGKINDEGLKQAIEAAYIAVRTQKKNKVVLMGDVILSPIEKIEYPVKVEFSPLSLFNGTLGGGLGGDGGAKQNKEAKP
jgi:hypothetical protein